jgi:hypothetical protein
MSPGRAPGREKSSGHSAQIASCGGRPRLFPALALFAILLAVYMANAYTQTTNDATGNVRLPLQILNHGRMTFTPEDSPYMFRWRLRLSDRETVGGFRSWNDLFQGETMRSYQERGALDGPTPKYFLAPTKQPGVYANTFGIGAGLLALPLVAAVKPFASSIDSNATLLWQVAKLASAMAVAGSAVFLFLTALAQLSWLSAFVLALIYGLCTCAWSVSSQGLTQHGPAELFLAMGTTCLLKKGSPSNFLAGLSYALATACRPTCLLVVVVVAVWQAIQDRRALLHFCLGALPFGLLLMFYGWIIFGDPFATGQLGVGPEIAIRKTGNPGLWQTPSYVGAAGLLFSPARGLLVYSPVALVALWGMGRVWRDRTWKDLRPVSLAALALFLISTKRFDWWGGWSYGYRLIMDAVTLLAFLAIPMVGWVQKRPARLAVVGVLALWSAGTQAVGALAFDVNGWNGRWAYTVVGATQDLRATYNDRRSAEIDASEHGGRVVPREQDVDKPEYRYRLWSLRDNPILFYIESWSQTRVRRQKSLEQFLRENG